MATRDGWQDGHHHDDPEETLAVVPAWLADDSTAALSLSRTLYPKKAVLAAAYKLSDRCTVLIDTDGDERWVLYLLTSPGAPAKAILPALVRELTDQALRLELEQEFGALRTLIVAQAFQKEIFLIRREMTRTQAQILVALSNVGKATVTLPIDATLFAGDDVRQCAAGHARGVSVTLDGGVEIHPIGHEARPVLRAFHRALIAAALRRE